MAAGDDSVVFLERSDAERYVSNVWSLSSRDSSMYRVVGVGQCYKDIYVREWNDFDFCSKWIVRNEADWHIIRDPTKTVFMKQDYAGHN